MALKATIKEETYAAPGPRGHWVVGVVPEFGRDPLGTLVRMWRQYGELVRLPLGPVSMFVASHPDLAQEILVNEKDVFTRIKSPNGEPIGLQLALGDGLLTNTDHASWLSQRRMMQPMFHRQRIATMGDKMAAAGERMLQRWQAHYQPGQSADIHQEMMQVTLDIINQTMFSTDVMGQADKIGPAITVLTHYIFRRVRSPFNLPLSWPTPRNREFWQARATLTGVIDGIIAQRRRRPPPAGSNDLLDMLLQARDEESGAGMSDKQLRDEVTTIFSAGHETTSNALSWSWYLLSQHPEVLQRLQQEVDRVLGGRTPTLADLPHLPYTQSVFEEALRLYPPAPMIIRMVHKDATLWDYTLPAGSRVLVSIFNIHHHPEFWPDPDRFDPDRFAPGNKEQRHRLAYMPFGAGQHTCIGNNFALMEGALLLALVARKYELRLAPGFKVEPQVAITMRPRYGLMMSLHPR